MKYIIAPQGVFRSPQDLKCNKKWGGFTILVFERPAQSIVHHFRLLRNRRVPATVQTCSRKQKKTKKTRLRTGVSGCKSSHLVKLRHDEAVPSRMRPRERYVHIQIKKVKLQSRDYNQQMWLRAQSRAVHLRRSWREEEECSCIPLRRPAPQKSRDATHCGSRTGELRDAEGGAGKAPQTRPGRLERWGRR